MLSSLPNRSAARQKYSSASSTCLKVNSAVSVKPIRIRLTAEAKSDSGARKGTAGSGI